jgi:hypothetical protein
MTESPPMSHEPTMPCRVCTRRSAFAFEAPLLDMTVRYHDCAHCGYLQTETPTWPRA